MVERALSTAQLQQRRTAALRHGLFAKAGPNLRARSYRVGRLVQRAYRDCPDLDVRDVATVRRWAQAECQSADRYARLEKDPDNEKLFEQWIQASRLALTYGRELFLTPASRLAAASAVSSLRAGDTAGHQRDEAELQARYGGQPAP